MSVAPQGGQDRIMIYGPKSDGTYIIEFRMADGESPTGWLCRTFRKEPLARPVSLRSGALVT